MSTDYYKILGVAEDADQDVIKKLKTFYEVHLIKIKVIIPLKKNLKKLVMLILFYPIKKVNLDMIWRRFGGQGGHGIDMNDIFSSIFGGEEYTWNVSTRSFSRYIYTW